MTAKLASRWEDLRTVGERVKRLFEITETLRRCLVVFLFYLTLPHGVGQMWCGLAACSCAGVRDVIT